MGSRLFGMAAAVGGLLLFTAAGTPAHAFGLCKGGTFGFGAGATAAAAAPAAKKHAWLGKRHAWRSAGASGYVAAPVRRAHLGYGPRYAYRYGYGPYYGYRSGVGVGVAVVDRDRRFRDRDRRYGFRDRDDGARVSVRARVGDDRGGLRRAGLRAEAGARAGRRGERD